MLIGQKVENPTKVTFLAVEVTRFAVISSLYLHRTCESTFFNTHNSILNFLFGGTPQGSRFILFKRFCKTSLTGFLV